MRFNIGVNVALAALSAALVVEGRAAEREGAKRAEDEQKPEKGGEEKDAKR